MPPLVLIDECGNPLVWNKPTRQEPEVEIEPMERLRMEAEKEAAKASSPKFHHQE